MSLISLSKICEIYDVYFYDSHCLMIMDKATRNIAIKQFYVFLSIMVLKYIPIIAYVF